MNRFFRTASTVLLSTLLLVGVVSCSSSEDTKKKDATTKAKAAAIAKAGDLPNYRYVDVDSVMANYNLAKDYSDQMLRLQNNLANEAKKHEASIGNFAKNMEDKYKNNGYLSEASFNQDQEKLAGMQQNAQNQLAQLENSAQQQYLQAQQIVNDSIQAFIDHYMTTHHYDAIFVKGATVYINPALDITDEIIEGLNARYNKKK